MKKAIILILITLLLTGCRAEYTININSDFVDENLVVEEKNKVNWYLNCSDYINETCIERFKEQKDEQIFANIDNQEKLIITENEYVPNYEASYLYKINHISDDKKIGYSYSYEFPINEYSKSTIVNSCIENFEVINSNNGIKIHAYGKFLCKYKFLEELTINIKSDTYKIENSNSNKKSGSTYIWNINIDGDNDIYFELNEKKENSNIITIIIIVSITLVLIIGISIVFIMMKGKKNNEI